MKSVRLFALAILALGLAAQRPAIAQSADQGLTYLLNEQYGKARTTFTALAKSSPTAENLFRLGNFYMIIGQPDSARTYFQQGLAADEKSALIHVGLGELELAGNNAAGAAEHFEHARKFSRNRNAEVFYQIGTAYLRHKPVNAKAAIEALEKAVDLDDQNPRYYVALGDAHLANNDASKASLNYEQAYYFDENYAPAYKAIGDLYLRTKNYNEALRRYQEAIAKDANYAPVYRELAELYFLGGQYKNAAENYAKYAQLGELTEENYFTYAGYLNLNKQYQESLAQLQKVSPDYPSPILHRLYAYNYFETKQYQEGLQQIQQFFQEAKPEDILAQDYEYAGRLSIAAGDTLQGLEHLRKAADSDSTKLNLYKEIAETYYEGREYAKAAETYAALEQKGGDLSATDYFRQGMAYYFVEEFGKADSALANVNERASTHLTGWVWRARTNAKIDSTSSLGLARPFYEKVIELAMADPDANKRELTEANLYLGYHYYLKADQENSEKYLNQVLALDPEHATATALLQAIEAGQIGQISNTSEDSTAAQSQ